MSLSTGSSSSSEDISFKPLKEKSSSLPYSLCCTSVKSFCCPKIDVAAEEGKEQLQNGADLKWFKEKTSQLPYIDDGASTVSAWSSVLELQENNVDLKYLPPKRGVRFNTKAIASEEDNDKSFSMPRKKRSFLRAIAKHLPRRRSLHPSWKDIDVAIYAKNTIEDDAHPLNCLIRRFGECRLDGNCNFIYDDPAEEEYIVKPDELPEAQEDPDYFPGLAQAEDDPANNSWDNFHWNGQDKPSMVDVNANGPKTFWCNDQWNHNEFDAGTPWRGFGCELEFCSALSAKNCDGIPIIGSVNSSRAWNDRAWNDPECAAMGLAVDDIVGTLLGQEVEDNNDDEIVDEKQKDGKFKYDFDEDNGWW